MAGFDLDSPLNHIALEYFIILTEINDGDELTIVPSYNRLPDCLGVKCYDKWYGSARLYGVTDPFHTYVYCTCERSTYAGIRVYRE